MRATVHEARLLDAEAALAERELPPLPTSADPSAVRDDVLRRLAEAVYGHSPARPGRTDAVVSHAPGDEQSIALTFEVDGGHGVARIRARLTMPPFASTDHPVPLVVVIGPGVVTADNLVPTQDLSAAGVGVCVVDTRSVTPDRGSGLAAAFTDPDLTWGHLAQWAWAARCAADHLRSVAGVDAHRIWVAGHSRYGKAALWAAATDARIAGVIANNSGCAGVAVERGKAGERYADAFARFPHWFTPQFRRLATTPADDLPFDQHWLTAAIHPRPVCVGSADDDAWADPLSELVGCLGAARAVHTGSGWQTATPEDPSVRLGHIRYHHRPGPHALTAVDWRHYLAAVLG